jgi:hypothetical protein
MSPAERRFDEESIDDMKADTAVDERLGKLPRSDEGEPVS